MGFMGFMQRSTAAGILIVCILMLRRFTWKKLSRRVFTILWKMAVLRLLLPFSFQAEVLPGSRENYVMFIEQGMGMEAAMKVESSGVVYLLLENTELFWFLGASLLALYFAWGYVRACLLLREAIPVGAVDSIGINVTRNCRILTRKVKILTTDRITTPMTYGIFYPKIVLPKSMEKSVNGKNRDMLFYVLRHELTHIKYMDNLWKLLLMAALCLHWFNPLVLVMYFLLNKDMEIACDESVISAMNEESRQKYAMTLVALAEICAFPTPLYSGFGKSAVSERIREIMNYKKMTKIGSFCAALVLLGSTVVFVSAKENVAEASPCASAVVMGESVENSEDKDCATVFFDEGISEERIGEIGNELLAVDGVTGVGYTSADEAWAVFVKEYLGEDTAVSFQGENPLKDSANYTVYLSERSEGTIRAIEGIDGVRRVNWQ